MKIDPLSKSYFKEVGITYRTKILFKPIVLRLLLSDLSYSAFACVLMLFLLEAARMKEYMKMIRCFDFTSNVSSSRE